MTGLTRSGLLILMALFSLKMPAQKKINNPEFCAANIKTVLLHRHEWNLSYPIISLRSDDKLLLSFDLTGTGVETYYYSFIHCDKDWNPSDIFESDYLDGFTENQIEEYDMSFNTTVDYVHYNLLFPNNNVAFKISGNYLIKVYPFGEPENPVLIKKFMLSDASASIAARPQRSKLSESYLSGQQIDFTVNLGSERIINPYATVFSTILQNGRTDNAKTNLKPDFTGTSKLEYNGLTDKNIFAGGSEFRYFDIKSLRYHSEYVYDIVNEYGNYHVKLIDSEERSSRQYFYRQDFNGKYYVAHQEGTDAATDADYVYVYFTLKRDYPLLNKNVHIAGALSNWQFSNENLMKYNSESKAYECRLLLKQGWYNYMYAAISDDQSQSVMAEFEGDHYETENDYIILVYYRDPTLRYDRLIASEIVKTNS